MCQHGERYSQQLVIQGAKQVLLSPQTQDTIKNMVKRHREIKVLARGYPAGNWQSQDSNLEHPPGPKHRVFPTGFQPWQ